MQTVRPEQLLRSMLLPGLPKQAWAKSLHSHALGVRHWDHVSCTLLSTVQNMSSGPLLPTLTDAPSASEADNVSHSHTHRAKRKAADGYETCGDTEGHMVQKVQPEL